MNFRQVIDNIPPVTRNLLAINILIFVAMALVPRLAMPIEEYGALYYITSDQFRVSQLLTYMFIHANFWHLFFNMFALFMFGGMMERVLGSQKFLFYYVSCGLGAAFVQTGVFAVMIGHYASMFADGSALTHLLRNSQVSTYEIMQLGINPSDPTMLRIFNLLHTPTVGASGAIFGILLAYGFMFPNMKIYMIFPPMPIRARVFVILYAVVELVQGLSPNPADNVAHFAHLGGMAFGLIMLIYWRKKGVIGGPYI